MENKQLECINIQFQSEKDEILSSIQKLFSSILNTEVTLELFIVWCIWAYLEEVSKLLLKNNPEMLWY